MSRNVMVINLDSEGGNSTDARRLEIVVDGLTLVNGAQLAIDTTMVSCHANGRLTTTVRFWRRHQGRRRGLILSLRKTGGQGRACQVVLAAEIRRRWSGEMANV